MEALQFENRTLFTVVWQVSIEVNGLRRFLLGVRHFRNLPLVLVSAVRFGSFLFARFVLALKTFAL